MNYIQVYLADTGENCIQRNLINSYPHFKLLECSKFINYTVDKIKNDSLSPDACVLEAIATSIFESSIDIDNRMKFEH